MLHRNLLFCVSSLQEVRTYHTGVPRTCFGKHLWFLYAKRYLSYLRVIRFPTFDVFALLVAVHCHTSTALILASLWWHFTIECFYFVHYQPSGPVTHVPFCLWLVIASLPDCFMGVQKAFLTQNVTEVPQPTLVVETAQPIKSSSFVRRNVLTKCSKTKSLHRTYCAFKDKKTTGNT